MMPKDTDERIFLIDTLKSKFFHNDEHLRNFCTQYKHTYFITLKDLED